jgi:hypothetical protein
MGEGNDYTLYSYVWNDPINWYDPYGLAGGGGLPQNGFGGAKNGSPGNPNGIDPAAALLDLPITRTATGASSLLLGPLAVAEGVTMCESGVGVVPGLLLIGKGGAVTVDGAIDYAEGLSGNGYSFPTSPNQPNPPEPSPPPSGRHSGPGYTPPPRPR